MKPMYIQTVLGPVPDDQLGIVMPHEHFPVQRGSESVEPPMGYRDTLERMQRESLRDAAVYGVRTMVEVTPIGMMRLTPMMQRLSRDTGIQVIASTGLYLQGNRPEWVKDKSTEDLAAVFIRELTDSMADVNARAWMIKVAAGKELSEEDEKVFRAAAMASRETGAAITTHSCSAIREHFDFLVAAGADPGRLYMGHADFGPADHREQLYVARNGGHLIFTCWGIQHFVDQDVLADRVVTLVAAGFADAVLMSIDYALMVSNNRMDLISMEYECPRRTPGFLFRYALPRLRARGITDDLIRHFLVDNTRRMLRRPDDKAEFVVSRAKHPAVADIRSGLERRVFSDQTAGDAIRIVNAYLAGWPYTRPIDEYLLGYWRKLPNFQPEHVWIAYRDGMPRAFGHGERDGDGMYIHLLAVVPGAVEEGLWLLGEMEAAARQNGVARLISPHYRSNAFYGAYVLGCEPYHPSWAIDGTDVWVRAGFRISHPAVLMVHDLSAPLAPAGRPPEGYTIVASPDRTEFDAEPFGFQAVFNGEKVAHCYARWYRGLNDPAGSLVGQLGHVGTDEPHRGKGLAGIMSRMCLEILRDRGVGECLVGTGLDNVPALRAYERIGFRRRFSINEWSKELDA